jgi:hypothetical protein
MPTLPNLLVYPTELNIGYANAGKAKVCTTTFDKQVHFASSCGGKCITGAIV